MISEILTALKSENGEDDQVLFDGNKKENK